MPKRVVVIASGETERRSVPHLVQVLRAEDIEVVEIRRPGGNKPLTLRMAEKLVKAAWYAPRDGIQPDKFVVLIDADAADPEEVLQPFRDGLQPRLGGMITADLQFACARSHLEAWYFGDVKGLRAFLGRDTGNVDASNPDEIKNPKLHLKQLLGERAYTAVVSEQIARRMNPEVIAEKSPSFRGFCDAIRNGTAKAIG